MGWGSTMIELSGNFLLFLLVFGMSATVDIRALQAQMQNRKAILSGCFLQFVILPLLGFIVVIALDMNETMGITLLVVTSSPGGSYSNWWCSMFNGDLALSVTMTAVSTILSTVTLPLNLLLYSKLSYDDDVIDVLDWASLFTALIVVIGAIVLGLFCSAKIHSHKFNVISNKLGNMAGIALVIFSATMSNTGDGDARIWNRDWTFYVGVSLPCLIGLLLANVFTTILGLEKPERVTVSIECCYQNVGIATSVALTMFKGGDLAEAMGVPLYYGLLEAVILGIYCIIAWKANWTKAPPDAPFWHIIVTSYEVYCMEKADLDCVEVELVCESREGETISDSGDTLFAYFRLGANSFTHTKQNPNPKEPSGMQVEYVGKRIVESSGSDEKNGYVQPKIDSCITNSTDRTVHVVDSKSSESTVQIENENESQVENDSQIQIENGNADANGNLNANADTNGNGNEHKHEHANENVIGNASENINENINEFDDVDDTKFDHIT